MIDLREAGTASEPCREELDRVTASAVDLFLAGRRVTERALATTTGLEPEAVTACVRVLVDRQVLRPSGREPHHYVFRPGRWPADRSVGPAT